MAIHQIGDVVRELRRALGVTQQELAVHMGAAVSSIALYEAGGSPNTNALVKLHGIAKTHGLSNLAAIFSVFLDVHLGLVPQQLAGVPGIDPLWNRDIETDRAVRLLGRIKQKPERLAAFFRFAKPEEDVNWLAKKKAPKS